MWICYITIYEYVFICYIKRGNRLKELSYMVSVKSMKCACNSCLCVVTLTEAIEKDGKYYCCDACANGHVNEKGCGHTGCSCN
jgi:metallothionein